MTFCLAQSEPLMRGIQRLVREQIDLASDEMGVLPIDPIAVPHQVRKRCKKIRALLRLAKAGMKNRKTYQQENKRVRDAARLISDIRDAQVLIDTYDRLMGALNPEIDLRAFGPIRRELSHRLQKLFHTRPSLEDSFREITAGLARTRHYISKEMPDDCPETVLYEGLHTTYARASQALADVLSRPSDEGFHEWRKQVKYHWYHCRVLRDVWSPVLSGRGSELHRLEECLGQDHDLGGFERFVAELRERGHSSVQPYDTLLRMIHQRKLKLRSGARQLGGRLFVESPKDFSKRICAYWALWIQEMPGTGDGSVPPVRPGL